MRRSESELDSTTATAVFAVAALLIAMYWPGSPAFAQDATPEQSQSSEVSPVPSGMGRLYVFREIRSFGAHIEDDVTIDGIPVQRLGPGIAFYCDLKPGSYVLSVFRHKTAPLKISVDTGQSQYVCISLRTLGGVSPRSGALTSDQSFDIRRVAPAYGLERMQGYRLIHATCRLP